MKAAKLRLTRTRHRFLPDPKRVITRPFIPGEEGFVYGQSRVGLVLERILAIPEEQVQALLDEVRGAFSPRHHDLTKVLDDHFQLVSRHLENGDRISSARRLLIGAYFTHEYAIEGAALFNPSLVPAPDQSDLPRGALRFVMSLRAVGEGHISSVEFRSGVIGPRGKIVFDARSPFVSTGHRTPNPSYKKEVFGRKLKELGLDNGLSRAVLGALADRFSFTELTEACASSKSHEIRERIRRETIESIHWLATSNYEVEFPPDSAVSERVIFPSSPNESRGMEDARFVRFVDDDRSVRYYATYTAYDGHDILPQLIRDHRLRHLQRPDPERAPRHEQGNGAVPAAHRREVRDALAPRQQEHPLHDLRRHPVLARSGEASDAAELVGDHPDRELWVADRDRSGMARSDAWRSDRCAAT